MIYMMEILYLYILFYVDSHCLLPSYIMFCIIVGLYSLLEFQNKLYFLFYSVLCAGRNKAISLITCVIYTIFDL